MSSIQEMAHPEGHDYDFGSPHLKHAVIRRRITESLRSEVRRISVMKGSCRVLEVGAGHGDFTDVLAAAGGEVVVTEMSGPAAKLLSERYAQNPRVSVTVDPKGDWLRETSDKFDLVACISVLHHIPDYLGFIRIAFAKTNPGGGFVSWQDPLWYPRRTRLNLLADTAAYVPWRLSQGGLMKGIGARVRRSRGRFDETVVNDMAEYHVVRSGVDELAIGDLAGRSFADVQIARYWSSQLSFFQSIGDSTRLETSFGIVARRRLRL